MNSDRDNGKMSKQTSCACDIMFAALVWHERHACEEHRRRNSIPDMIHLQISFWPRKEESQHPLPSFKGCLMRLPA
jgi:hypothetical protein